MKKIKVFRAVKKLTLALILWFVVSQAGAKIYLPAIISSHMVLQQNTMVELWGKTSLSHQVSLQCSWDKVIREADCDDAGKWSLSIRTPLAGGPYEIVISDTDDRIVIENVMIGEVWFCSGQSNMEFPMGISESYWHTGVISYETEIKEAVYPNIRLFSVKKQVAEEPVDTCWGEWLECNPEPVNSFSAVAYYFGRMIYHQLKVPVGLIHSSWGGTPAESWTRKEILKNDTAFQCIFDKYRQYLDDYPEAYKKYREDLENWRIGVEKGTITGIEAKKPPRAPVGPGHHKSPSVLYNGMVAPVIPYTIRGVIWYQGESNADRPLLYSKLFPEMIKNWREDWKQGDFPFYFVQISAHDKQNPLIREAQLKTMQIVPNTGMVVSLDVGDSLDIHPRDKKTVGERLALWALSETYNQPGIVCSGPVYRDMKIEGESIRLYFDYTGSGLKAKNGKLEFFEIAGEDGIFFRANARIENNTIIVFSDKVKYPVTVRYAWRNYMVPDLFNFEGLPASSFRTQFNPWPEIKVEMKPWTRWWWMGSAVDEKNLGNLLETYAQKGFGGVEVTPIYGAKGYENRYIPFLSDHWMQMLRYTCAKSDSLHMGVDINTGTGWPFGGPQVSLENAATKIIIQQYNLTGGQDFSEKIIATDQDQRKAGAMLQALMAYNNKGKVTDLTRGVSPDGTLTRVPAKGNWTLYAAFCGKTLQKVKRAAPGGEGYTLDHFSTRALDQYLSRFDTVFKGNTPRIRCLFNDSYEVYNASWTPLFFEQFLMRRGYDLKKYVRELTDAGDPEIIARVKSDYRQTMSEMLLDHFTANWTRWAHTHGMLTRNQAHGSPANLLDLYATVDIPEIETFGSSYFPIPGLRHDSSFIRRADHDPLFLKLASSAAHVSGKKLVSCETFTWLGEHFRVALSQCKPEVEQAFLAGVNHVFVHGTTYSPADAAWPGWLFYASVNFTPSNSFWPHLEGLNSYIARCQSILQAGRPDNDILVYWPVYDLWQQADKLEMTVTVHDSRTWLNLPQVRSLSAKGYTFDFISDKQILETQTRAGNLFTVTDGSPYRALFIPACRYMPLETLKKIMELAGGGAHIVLEQMPEGVPGLYHYEERNKAFKQLLKRLKFSNPDTGILQAKLDKGMILVCPDAIKAMEYLGIMCESLGDKGLKFIRRKSGEGIYYYLVNHTPQAVDTLVPVNVRAKTFLLLDPMTGEWGKISSQEKDSTTLIRIRLLPGETCFVFAGIEVIPELPEWSYFRNSQPGFSIEGPWELEFVSGGPVIPAKMVLERPVPWTSLTLKVAEGFSGTASYSAEFVVPDTKADEYILILDDVHESARVWINSMEAGLIWSVPFQCKVGRLLHPGVNTIRIEVANLMANRIREMDLNGTEWKKFHDINFVNLAYKPFNASDWSILTSGLGGPVRLVPLTREK
jgi:hypothetical protein